jgi:cell division septation protein DedD
VRTFSLQVASRRNRARSLAHAEALRREGLEAFTVPAQIRGKGMWYRVLIGGFDSASSAVEAGKNLQAKGRVQEAVVLSLPYAVEVVGLPTPDQAADAVALARRSGYLPLLRPENGDPSAGSRHLLRVEAFRTSKDAEEMAQLLRAGGLHPRVTQR